MPAASDDLRLESLRTAPLDSWIALSEDEQKIVATGKTYEEVVDASDKAGVNDPVIIKTPKYWCSFSI